MTTATAMQKVWGQIVARTWQDDDFKQRLLADPAGVLRAQGVELPAGVELRLVEDTERLIHLKLPARTPEPLTEAQLEAVAGGWLRVGTD
jgi:hypothetical protein